MSSPTAKYIEVDCIIYASGFEISADFRRRLGFEINGRDGLSLYDYYQDGFRTLHGHSSRSFPNWFYIGIGAERASVNMTAMFDDQARHIAYIIAEAKRAGRHHGRAHAGRPRTSGSRSSTASTSAAAASSRRARPGYYNNEGAAGRQRPSSAPTPPASTPSTSCSRTGASRATWLAWSSIALTDAAGVVAQNGHNV